MSCVNTKYTPAELESIFLWDAMCEKLPLTLEERRECSDREYYAIHGELPKRETSEEKRAKRREYNRRYRESHREKLRASDQEYRNKNRKSINERQKEYDAAKRATEKGKRVSAQP